MTKKTAGKKREHLTFEVKKLGNVHSGRFIHKPLTVFCGPNNSGKTWVMYALYSFYKLAREEFGVARQPRGRAVAGARRAAELREAGVKYAGGKLAAFHRAFNAQLSDDLNVSDDILKGANFSCAISQEKWMKRLAAHPAPNVFLAPAERNGLHLFYHELRSKRTALLHHASKEKVDLHELLKDVMRSRYAKPIAEYINRLNEMTERPRSGDAFHAEALRLQKELARGRYKINRLTDEVTFQPYQKGKAAPSPELKLHITSSAVKSLFALWLYCELYAQTGDVLMIDEPELNIHPGDQLVLTHLLARLVNKGVNVTVSTHSDYITSEINNLISLGGDTSGKLLGEINGDRKNGDVIYAPDAVLSGDDVGMYLFGDNMIKPLPHLGGDEFQVTTFDEVIFRQEKTRSQIYLGLPDDEEDE